MTRCSFEIGKSGIPALCGVRAGKDSMAWARSGVECRRVQGIPAMPAGR
ncbi:hypothetical protein [Desulfovibrio sp. Huiquan2017]|nr:hypothetical protein [Desulfovibrio sp. Huiquan2017]